MQDIQDLQSTLDQVVQTLKHHEREIQELRSFKNDYEVTQAPKLSDFDQRFAAIDSLVFNQQLKNANDEKMLDAAVDAKLTALVQQQKRANDENNQFIAMLDAAVDAIQLSIIRQDQDFS